MGSWEFSGCGREFGEADVPVETGRVLVAVGDVQVHSPRTLVAQGRD